MRRRKRLNDGFTIVEVLAGLFITSLISLAALGFLDSIHKETAKQESLIYRNNESAQFSQYLLQPSYVGALAEYEVNKALKQCLDIDDHLCDIYTSYSLVAVDLLTGKQMDHMDPGAKSFVDTKLSFKVHCPLDQTSCDAVDYINITIENSTKDALGLLFSRKNIVTVEPKRTNVVTLVPNTEIEPGHPANLVIFVDGSNSMSSIKDSFKATLEKFIDSIKDLNLVVKILPLNMHSYPSFGSYYTEDGTGTKTYFGWTKFLPAGTIFYSDLDFRLSATTYKFTDTMTAVDRTNAINSINSEIEKIFIDGATLSAKDAGLCGVLRTLEDFTKGNSPFLLDNGTPTVFMVLTNENDESSLVAAGSSMIYPNWGNGFQSSICASSARGAWTKESGYRSYSGQQYYSKMSATADYIIDGAPIKTDVSPYLSISVPYSADFKDGGDCMSSTGALDADIQSKLKEITGTYSYLPGAQFLGTYNVTACQLVLRPKGLSTDRSADAQTKNLCETYFKSDPYSLKYLLPGSCIYVDLSSESTGSAFSGIKIVSPYVPESSLAHSTNDVALATYDYLKSKFKIENFYFSAVINPSSGVCPATVGSEVGAKYEKLAAFPGMKSSTIPICSADYGSSFISNATSFLKAFALGDFKLPPNIAPRISGIEVLRGSTLLYPALGNDYSIKADLLVFSLGYLQSSDVVRVYLK